MRRDVSSSAFAVDIARPAWLSSGRWPLHAFMPEGSKAHHWLAGGLAAASFAAVLALIAVDKPSTSLHVALMLFSISLPFDIFIFIAPLPKNIFGHLDWIDYISMFVFVLYLPLPLAGITVVFWHFGCVFGLSFLVTSLLLCAFFPFVATRYWPESE
jgi:hypothetical protein